jgi:hypothetical protein
MFRGYISIFFYVALINVGLAARRKTITNLRKLPFPEPW